MHCEYHLLHVANFDDVHWRKADQEHDLRGVLVAYSAAIGGTQDAVNTMFKPYEDQVPDKSGLFEPIKLRKLKHLMQLRTYFEFKLKLQLLDQDGRNKFEAQIRNSPNRFRGERMSVNDLIESLRLAGENGREIDFRAIRENIYEEHDKATTIDDRVKLLQAFNLVMDLVEKNLERGGTAPNVIQDFRNARESDYRLLLVKEAMVGENVCAETLAAITQREVSAGRMTPDHTLYTMAQEQVAKPHHSRAELVAIAA